MVGQNQMFFDQIVRLLNTPDAKITHEHLMYRDREGRNLIMQAAGRVSIASPSSLSQDVNTLKNIIKAMEGLRREDILSIFKHQHSWDERLDTLTSVILHAPQCLPDIHRLMDFLSEEDRKGFKRRAVKSLLTLGRTAHTKAALKYAAQSIDDFDKEFQIAILTYRKADLGCALNALNMTSRYFPERLPALLQLIASFNAEERSRILITRYNVFNPESVFYSSKNSFFSSFYLQNSSVLAEYLFGLIEEPNQALNYLATIIENLGVDDQIEAYESFLNYEGLVTSEKMLTDAVHVEALAQIKKAVIVALNLAKLLKYAEKLNALSPDEDSFERQKHAVLMNLHTRVSEPFQRTLRAAPQESSQGLTDLQEVIAPLSAPGILDFHREYSFKALIHAIYQFIQSFRQETLTPEPSQNGFFSKIKNTASRNLVVDLEESITNLVQPA